MSYKVAMKYQEKAKAVEFNQFLSGVVPHGVFTNQDSCLSLTDATLTIKAGTVLYVPNKTTIGSDATSVRVEIVEDHVIQTQQLLAAAPYVCCHYEWADLPDITGQFVFEAKASYDPSVELVIGRQLFENGVPVNYFDYSVQTRPVFPGSSKIQFTVGRGGDLVGSGAATRTLHVGEGQAIIQNTLVEFAGGDVVLDTEASMMRKDLLCLDVSGSLVVVKGTPHATAPAAPTFPVYNQVPLAIVTIQSGIDKMVRVDTVKRVESSRQNTSDYHPINSVIMYDGTDWVDNVTMPGWYACIGAGNGTPDLVDKFVRGKDVATSGSTGGADSVVLTIPNLPSHTHTLTDTGHVHILTENAHNHAITDPTHTHGFTGNAHTHGITDGGHTHTISQAAHTHTATQDTHTHSVTVTGTTNPEGGHRHYCFVRNDWNSSGSGKFGQTLESLASNLPGFSAIACHSFNNDGSYWLWGESSQYWPSPDRGSTNYTGIHTHTVSSGGTALAATPGIYVNSATLTISNNTSSANVSNQATVAGGYNAAVATGISLSSASTGVSMSNAVTGISMASVGNGTSFSILPPYYTLIFIKKKS